MLVLLPMDGNLSGLVTMAVESDDPEPPAHQDMRHKILCSPAHSFRCPPLVEQNSRLSDSQCSNHAHHLYFLGHHQVVLPSMSSLPKATCPVHSPLSLPLVWLTLLPRDFVLSLLGTILNTSCITMTAGLPSILSSDTSLSTLK